LQQGPKNKARTLLQTDSVTRDETLVLVDQQAETGHLTTFATFCPYMDISHNPLSADKAGWMITNHTNIQTKAALWDSLIAIQIHTHDPITRDYTKQLQLHANIPN